MYKSLKTIHILAVVVLLGSKPLYLSLLPQMRDATPALLGRILKFVHWYEIRAVKPSALTIIVTGSMMTWGPFSAWNWLGPDGRFILMGIILMGAVMVCMETFFKPAMEGLVTQLSGENGTISEPAWTTMRRVLWVAGILDALSLVVMVFKPMF